MENAPKTFNFAKFRGGDIPRPPLAEQVFWSHICYWTATRRILAKTFIHCMPRIDFITSEINNNDISQNIKQKMQRSPIS